MDTEGISIETFKEDAIYLQEKVKRIIDDCERLLDNFNKQRKSKTKWKFIKILFNVSNETVVFISFNSYLIRGWSNKKS